MSASPIRRGRGASLRRVLARAELDHPTYRYIYLIFINFILARPARLFKPNSSQFNLAPDAAEPAAAAHTPQPQVGQQMDRFSNKLTTRTSTAYIILHVYSCITSPVRAACAHTSTRTRWQRPRAAISESLQLSDSQSGTRTLTTTHAHTNTKCRPL
jgi:hypothetical protein